MRKIISGLILTSLFSLAVSSLVIPQTALAALAADPAEGTVVYVCSVDGEQHITLSACESDCKSSSGIQGFCTKTVIIGPDHIIKLINKYTQWFIAIVGSIAVIMIIIGGLQLMLARGDETKVKNARKMILWAIVGLVIVLLAGGAIWTITRFLTTA